MAPTPFDFEQHCTSALKAYGAVRDRYTSFAAALETILRMALRDLPTHNISARAKDLDSFARKAAKAHPEDAARPKYPDPMTQIEDLAGARVITYILGTQKKVEEVLAREFDVVERSDKGDQLMEKALVGYRSIHFIVRMKAERTKLLEYREFDGLRAEIQIRTILQHAWAEIEHDMRYKPSAEPNKELSQRFTALAGLIEVGDREFEQIYQIDEQRRKDLVALAQINDAAPEPDPRSMGPEEPDHNPLPTPGDTVLNPTVSATGISTQPKQLIAAGRYAEAIASYDILVEREPTQYAHRLGRAKARFLCGDVAGALADIYASEKMNPGHPNIARVLDLIEGRSIERIQDQRAAVRQGHLALRRGDASEALARYEEAESLGFNPVFSVFNQAMARFLQKRPDLARQTLDRIDPYPGSKLQFNVIALRTLCYLLAGGSSVSEAVQTLQKRLRSIEDSAGYRYGESPLVDLESGVRAAFEQEDLAKISPAFEILNGAKDDRDDPSDRSRSLTTEGSPS